MSLYVDHAAMKPLLPEVQAQIRNFAGCYLVNPSSIYSTGRITRKLVEQAREKIAEAIGADADEIYFTSGSTEAINWLYYTTWMSDESYDHIYTTPIEHKAILKQICRYGGCIHTLQIDKSGRVKTENLPNILEDYSTLVIGYVNNEIGVIQPIKEIVDICHKSKTRVFVDATQAVGNIPINVHNLGVDYLCCSGQKIGALSGCGFLYVHKGAPLEPMELGGAQERGLRSGTENVLGILTLATAMKVITHNIETRAAQTQKQRDKIITGLLEIPKSHLNGSFENRVCNNINISFEGIEGESLVLQLDTRSIQCSTGSACNSQSIEPSYVLKAIGLDDDTARASIRITIGDDITDLEVNYLIRNVKECVELLRSMSPKWKEINSIQPV